MKFTTICVTALAALTQAAPAKREVSTVKLAVDSKNQEINGHGLTALHEGAGYSFLFIGSGVQELEYDDSSKQLYQRVENNGVYSFRLEGNFMGLGFGEGFEVEFEKTYLKVNGTTDFHACKNVQDPYNYSKDNYALMNYNGESAPDGCIPLRIKSV